MLEISQNNVDFHVGDLYDNLSDHIISREFIRKTLSIHYGYYSKETKTLKDAIFKMNDYVADLLHLNNGTCGNILDAGSGLGGPSIYLAKKYPKNFFTGITISPKQIKYSNMFAKKQNVANTNFLYGDYHKTIFPNHYFDGIFALESCAYATDHDTFLQEMNRVLKPGGRLVIIDGFRTPKKLSSFMKKIYQRYCFGYGNINLGKITDYEEILRENNFSDIIIKDISKNIRRSIIDFALIEFSNILKKINDDIDPKKSNRYLKQLSGNTYWSGLCGICKVISYYSISAVKK